jgi:hypothetical protein
MYCFHVFEYGIAATQIPLITYVLLSSASHWLLHVVLFPSGKKESDGADGAEVLIGWRDGFVNERAHLSERCDMRTLW